MTHAKAINSLDGVRARIRNAFAAFQQNTRLGILIRLGLVLLAVVGLAVTANVLTQQDTTVVRTQVKTEIREVAAASTIQPPAATPPRVETPIAPPRLADIAPLKVAVKQLHNAALTHTESASSSSAILLLKAELDLEKAQSVYLQDAAASLDARYLRDLQRRIAAFTQHQRALGRIADERKASWEDEWRRLDALETRLKAALERSFKLFGRVFAQQSLLELTRRLDAVREHFKRLDMTGSYDSATIDAILAGEEKFLTSLDERERSLTRSQGAQWIAEVRQEFSIVMADRAAILRADELRQSTVAGFATAAEQVLKRIDKPVRSTVRPQSVNVAALQALPLAPTHRSVALGASSPPPPMVEKESVESTTKRGSKTVVAWISAGVLGVLLLLSAGMVRQLDRLARHDPLTQLPNRRQLFTRLKKTLSRAQRAKKKVGVLCLDLDNFKIINDSLGHEFGDRVLQAIAERLRETVGTRGFVANLGGDEFTIILDAVNEIEDIRSGGDAVTAAFQKHLIVEGRELLIGTCIGASIYPDHGKDAEALLRAADAALFHAKESGRNQLRLFSRELLDAAATKFEIEQGLRRAVERGEFELVFQPEISVDTHEVTIVEALLRWRLPDGRLASPGEFLVVAEQSGLITQISAWVVRTAIATAARWHHGGWPDVRIAVNISARDLLDERFVGNVDLLLKEHHLPPHCIEFELTESVLQTGASTVETLYRLRAMGIAIALDDFGTGYSSLASLEQLPLTRVKLDRSLIEGVDTSTRSAAIAHAIIGMCQGLGLQVTAEGIERPRQLAALSCYRSVIMQGYLLSKPIPAENLLLFLPRAAEHLADILLSIDNLPQVIEHTATHKVMQNTGVFKQPEFLKLTQAS